MTDLIKEYLALDPTGSYLKSIDVFWSNSLQMPVKEVELFGLAFEQLLCDHPSIPELDNTYFPLKENVEAFHAAINCDLNFAITGPAGTGKTALIQYMAAFLKRPLFIVDLHEDYRPDSLFGEYKLDSNGSLQWKDGPITEAMKNPGSIVLLDEANFCSPAVLACLHRVLAGNNIFTHEKFGSAHEVEIKRPKGILFTMACNGLTNSDESSSYVDTKEMNRAFLDRWGVVCEAGYPAKIVEMNILKKKLNKHFSEQVVKDLTFNKDLEAKLELLVTTAAQIRTAISNGDISIAYSVRRTEAVAKLICALDGNFTRAIHMGVLAKEDRNTAKFIDDLIFTKATNGLYARKFSKT